MTSSYNPDPMLDYARPISWSAVGAGAVAALITHSLLNMLGLGLGALTLDVADPAADAGAGAAFAWWSVSGILSALVGGIVAGRIMRASERNNAMTHGLLAWAASSLVVIASVTGMLGGSAAAVGGPLAARIADYGAMTGAEAAAGGDAASSLVRAASAAEGIATGALFSVLALLIGALAAAIGARMAMRGGDRADRRPRPPAPDDMPPIRHRDGREIRPH